MTSRAPSSAWWRLLQNPNRPDRTPQGRRTPATPGIGIPYTRSGPESGLLCHFIVRLLSGRFDSLGFDVGGDAFLVGIPFFLQ